MPADAGVVVTAGRNVKVKVWLPVLLGDIPGKVGYFHLLREGFVHILQRGRVQKTESGLRNCSKAGNVTGKDTFFLAELHKRSRYLCVIVYA